MSRSKRGARYVGRVVSGLAVFCAAVITVSTLLALFADHWWVAELFVHFRLQYLVAAAALLAIVAPSRRPIASAAMLACVAVNGWGIRADFAAPAAAPIAAAESDRPIRLISVNVRGGSTDPAGLVALVEAEAPDMLLVLEHSPPYDHRLAELEGDYPYRLTAPSWRPFGIALYSRLPVEGLEIYPLGPTDAVRARISFPGGHVDFIGVHLLSPTSAVRAAQRDEQLASIGRLAESAGDAFLVCGDLNITRYSPHFRPLLDGTGLVDTGAGHGLMWTWPVTLPALGIQIDHCLAGPAVRVANVAVLGDVGSDHYPLLIEFSAGRNG